MKLNANKLAAGLLTLIFAFGAAMPASAAPAVTGLALNLTLPWQRVAVESVELGEYSDTMAVGETQQLRPYVLPEDATDASISLASEDNTIIQVGSNGLIGAIAEGTTRVAVSAGGVTNYYTITVVPDPSTIVASIDAEISATELAVGETASISVSVSPSTSASYAEISFASSNESVATVNSFGRVTGVGKGKATISVICGELVKTLDVSVTVPTDGIHLNTNYLVLKPGESATITGSVTPSTASQALSFHSNDTTVVTVSSGGVVTAVGTGSTSVTVTNGDSSSMVSVIVNRGGASSTGTESGDGENGAASEGYVDPIVEQIEKATGDLTFTQAELPTITGDMLTALRKSGYNLTVIGDGYSMTMRADRVKNTTNELSTAINFTESDDGIEFVLNGGNALPGNVEITLDDSYSAYPRLYLYNETNEKWQFLNNYTDGVITADAAGHYLLTTETLNFITMNFFALVAAGIVLAAIIGVYIIVKKRYWFW